jgi:hypothetical protein
MPLPLRPQQAVAAALALLQLLTSVLVVPPLLPLLTLQKELLVVWLSNALVA